jgi:hypothetical protein
MPTDKKKPVVKNVKSKTGVKQSYTSKDGLYSVKKEFDTKGKIKSKNVSRTEKLSPSDLKALSHQERGMGRVFGNTTFVKTPNAIKNETGTLTSAQTKQLKQHMKKASTIQKIYEGLPNLGRAIGRSAADLPKNSILKNSKYKTGGVKKTASAVGKKMPTMKKGGKK